MKGVAKTPRALGLLCGAALSFAGTPAHAHHVPGHAASESARNLDGVAGTSAIAQSRVGLVGAYSLARTVSTPAHTGSLALLGEWAPKPALSIGAQMPWVFVRAIEDEGPAPLVHGYGDTRVYLRVTPHADKLVHRLLTVGVDASLPTRSFATPGDPGRTWIGSASVYFTRSYRHLYWQTLGLASVETRPAGTAFELSAGALVGARFDRGTGVSGGVVADMRVAALCREVDGSSSYCAQGRITELDRPSGATRVSLRANASQAINLGRERRAKERPPPMARIFVGLQAPVTPRRDFDLGVSAGTQVSF